MSDIYYPFIINNFDISTIPYVQVYSIDYFGGDMTLSLSTLARSNARKLSAAFAQSKQLMVSVYIKAPNRVQADKTYDILMSKINIGETNVQFIQSGIARQYTATYYKTAKNNSGVGRGFAQPPQGGLADLAFQFECSDSYGYDTNYSVIQPATNYTTQNVSIQYTQGGTANTQVPIVQVKVTAVTGATGSIIIGNLTNGQSVTVTRTWAINDILIVDSQNKLVQVNGVDVTFIGGIPEVPTGTQTLTYSDTFTTRTVNIFAYVYNRYN